MAPTDVQATAVDGQVQVSWSDAQAAETPNLTFTAADAKDATLSCTEKIKADKGSCTIDGVDPASTDSFTVTARDESGGSKTSTPSDPIVPVRHKTETKFYAGMTLTGSDLTSLDLSGLDLTESTLAWDDFTGSTLAGTDLSNANLAWDTLTGVDLTKTNLSNATLYGVASGGITGWPAALPDGWALRSGYLVGPGARLSSASLTNTDLAGASLANADLTWSNLTGTDLSKADLRQTNLAWANLSNTNLEGADLSGANLYGVSSGGITGEPRSLPEGWSLVNGYLIGANANLTHADLSGLRLEKLDLRGANLAWANLSGSTLLGVDLTKADLSWADLSKTRVEGTVVTDARLWGVSSGGIEGEFRDLPKGWNQMKGYLFGPNATLTNADFSGMELRGLDLSGANLAFSDLTKADLSGTNLSGSDLAWTTLAGARIEGVDLSGAYTYGVSSGDLQGDATGLPDGFNQFRGYLVGPYASLTHVDFSGAELKGFDLTGANLAFSDLTKADLNGVNLDQSNLAWTTLTGAQVEGATLTAADAYGLTSGDLQGEPADVPAGWTLVNGYLVGAAATVPWAKLAGSDLSNMDLSNANFAWDNLAGVNLDGADLSNANLYGVSSGDIIGTPDALPEGWRLVNGYLVGPGATLAWADLRGADLSRMDLSNTNLAWANLQGANLDGTDLKSAYLLGITTGNLVATPDSLPKGWHVSENSLTSDHKLSKEQRKKVRKYWKHHPAAPIEG